MLQDNIDLNFNPDDYLRINYPTVDDCFLIDKQLSNLNKDLDKITKMKPIGKGVEKIKIQDNINKLKSKILLLIKTRENQFSLKDCRNKIETTRQEESANVFSTTSANAEERILTDNKTKQYLLIGIGGLALLGVLLIIVKNKK
jgi:hypothetical protein